MPLSPDQVQYGYWFHRPQESFPPAAITYPEEYDGGEFLNLLCTQLDLSAHQQRSLVARWVKKLPLLGGVRTLWLSSRVNQDLFEAVCEMPHLAGLYIKWSAITRIESLLKMTSLTHLHIGSSSQIRSIDCLEGMEGLAVLELENFKHIHDLAPIGSLAQLEGLAIQGSTWTTQKVDSLEPLAQLGTLKYLFLTNLKSEDGTLRPIARISSLVHLQTALWWPEEDCGLLRNSLPNLKYGSLVDQDLVARF